MQAGLVAVDQVAGVVEDRPEANTTIAAENQSPSEIGRMNETTIRPRATKPPILRIVSPDQPAGLYLSRVKRTRRQPEPERLESLAKQAADYALHMMRTTGSVLSMVIADTARGE